MRHRGRVEPPRSGLLEHGPLVEVWLSDAMAEFDESSPGAAVKMMIDTGANLTIIEQRVAESLGVMPIRFEQMVGVSQKPEEVPVYRLRVGLYLSSDDGAISVVTFESDMLGMPTPLADYLHVGLLGRDFLQPFTFSYHGHNGTFELAVPEHVARLHQNTEPAPTTPPRLSMSRNQRKAERRGRRR